jgi:dienelactone hydrolase
MKKLFILFLLFTQSGFAHNKTVPLINASLVKVDELLWDLKALSKSPDIEWINKEGNIYALLYKSVDYEGKPTQVFAYYSNPDIIMGKKHGKKKFPGVVLIHGGGGKAFKEWVEKWASEGYAAIAMDLSGNDGDGKKLVQAGADQSDLNKFQKIENGNLRNVWSYHAVASVILAHSLLLSLPEVEASKTCVTGISWGGYLTCIVASLDNRFKAAVPVYGCGYYDESDIFKESLNRLSLENKQKWMKYFDPSVYLPFAHPRFLFINGNKDLFYNVIPYHKTYTLVDRNQRTICIKPEMQHSHIYGWEPEEIRYFFESVINNGCPLIKVSSVLVKDSLIKLSYQSPVTLSLAEFYYTNDSVSTNAKREWTMQKAEIGPDKQTVIIPRPKEGFKYAFFFLMDYRNLAVSSEFIIN